MAIANPTGLSSFKSALNLKRLFWVSLIAAFVLGFSSVSARATMTIPERILADCLKSVLHKLAPPKRASVKDLPAPEVLAAYRTMLTMESSRTPEAIEALKAFKNLNDSRRTLDLLDPALAVEDAKFDLILNHLRAGKEISWHGGAHLYRQAVMDLRAGDTIRAGGSSAVLGKFIGSGNLTHIYEDANHPDRVIRVPFHLWEGHPWSSRRHIKEFSDMAATLNEGVPRVSIQSVADDFAFATVTRVDSSLNGRDFLNARPERPGREWLGREKRLRELVLLHHGIRLTEEATIRMARQFLWDPELGDWVMVDWEGLLST